MTELSKLSPGFAFCTSEWTGGVTGKEVQGPRCGAFWRGRARNRYSLRISKPRRAALDFA